MTYVWKQTILVLLVGFSIVMLAGDAGAQSPDVSGTWTGGTTSGAATYVLVLKQDGQKVKGTLSGAGTDDGPVTGIISGNTLRLTYDDGRETTPSLNIKGDRIQGVFSGGSEVVLRRTSK